MGSRELTEQESAQNEILNMRIKTCEHEPVLEGGLVRCLKCKAIFTPILHPLRPSQFRETNLNDLTPHFYCRIPRENTDDG